MERPAGVDPETWEAFSTVLNRTPVNRRTVDIPVNNQQAITAIARMVNAGIMAEHGQPTVGTDRPEIFKANEAPKWEDENKFPEYFSRLRFFMRGATVSDDRCRQACFLIFQAWTGSRLQQYAQEVDVGTLARGDWEATQENILQWLNNKFRSKTDFPESTARWDAVGAKLRKRHFANATDFYLAFEIELNLYNAARTRQGLTRAGDTEVTAKFVSSLPSSIAARIRETASDLDEVPYGTYKSKIAYTWEAHRQADIKINEITASGKRAREEEEDEERSAKRAFLPQGRPGPCREGWDNAPANLQGTIQAAVWMSPEERRLARERHDRVKKAGVCARCRMPRRPGHLINTFQPVGPFEVRARMVEAEEETEQFHDAEENQD